MTYTIRYSNGRTDTADTYQAACDAVRADYPEAEIGHDGDLTSGGDRTLCWADEESSRDDDGARAVASIYGPRTGQRVSGGRKGTEDYDEGTVLSIGASGIVVGWDSGVRTTVYASEIRAL